jgi:multidrug resistance efflux pump
MNEKADELLNLSPDMLLVKCLALPTASAAVTLHERYYLHHLAQAEQPLADAQKKIAALQAEIAKISGSVNSARNAHLHMALADSSGREKIDRHFAQRRAA